MSFKVLYRGQFVNQETNPADNSNAQQIITIDIEDTESGEADEPETIVELEMADIPLVIEVVNNEEKKHSVVRGKQANISVNTSEEIGIETFVNGGDNRYKVHIYSEVETLLRGYLSISDLQEPFQPDPNVFVLTAMDGLGFLEGEPLTDLDGSNPSFENRIIDYIVWCLAKSGHSLPLKIVMNWRERYARPLNLDDQDPFVFEANFFAPGSGNKIRMVDTPASRAFFYIGQRFTTTDAGANTGPFTVIDIQLNGVGGIEIFVEETVSAFSATLIPATFTDITAVGHLYNSIYLDSKTWEGSDIGTMLDSLEVLKRILGFQCFIEQKNGYWWIINVDEIRIGSSYYVAEFDADGNFVETTQQSMLMEIGIDSPMQFMNDDAGVTGERPLKRLDLVYDYEYRDEFICNEDFERGTGPEPTGAESETLDYTLQCWDFLRSYASGIDVTPFVGSTGLLRKLYENGYEKERYLVLENAGGFIHYFRSQAIRVAAKSKFDFSINYKYNSDYSAVRTEIAHVRVVGDDGFVYDWEYDTQFEINRWVQKTTSDPVFTEEVQDNITGLNTSEWLSFSATCPAIPVSGKLYIRLMMGQAAGNIKYFSGFSFNYIPLINASYRKYSGQKHSIEQVVNPEKYKSKVDDTVYMSDAPDPNIKGALLKKELGEEIFSGSAFFGGNNDIQVDDDKRGVFQVGMLIQVLGTTNNNIEARITSVTYALVINKTTILLTLDTVSETASSARIHIVNMVLANRFYDASVYPDRDLPDETVVHPFGELQAFGYWNQYNRVTRKIEGTVDRTQSGTEIPDMVHKYSLTDAHANTTNKIFALLHFTMDLHLCEWDAFFHEVEDSTIPKVNEGHSFKYITQ